MRSLVSAVVKPVTLRHGAMERLRELSRIRGTPQALKISIESGGCSGFQYIIDLVPKSTARPGESLFEQGDCAVIVDDTSLKFMSDCEVDFTEDMVRSAFQVVRNEVASAKCGCGTSFNIGLSLCSSLKYQF